MESFGIKNPKRTAMKFGGNGKIKFIKRRGRIKSYGNKEVDTKGA